jgi:hypothetical protein
VHPDVEMYAVMRAEYKYHKEGFKKLASKYWFPLTLKSKAGKIYRIPIEDCGVDNFFQKGRTNLVCESKFTRNEGTFAEWKQNEEALWRRLGVYKTGKGKRCRQMSWAWIRDRASLAVRRPAGERKASDAEKAALTSEVLAMDAAVQKEKVRRVVNAWGAAEVPPYPGRYAFRLAERSILAEKKLSVKWTMDLSEDIFLKLEQDFDDWADNSV